jgi:hypothetical protein
VERAEFSAVFSLRADRGFGRISDSGNLGYPAFRQLMWAAMRWRFQYSLSSIMWLTLCLALLLSSVLMYRRMEKAERENGILRGRAGYSVGEEPVVVAYNWPIDVDVDCRITSMMKGADRVFVDCDSSITIRNNFDKEVKLHFPLLRMAYCTSNSSQFVYSKDIEPKLQQQKTITLKPGESCTIPLGRASWDLANRDLFEGKKSSDDGRWTLVFGVPAGENPDDYVVGTLVTNAVHWKVDKNCKVY